MFEIFKILIGCGVTNCLTLFACGEGGFCAQDVSGLRLPQSIIKCRIKSVVSLGFILKTPGKKHLLLFPSVLHSLCVYKNKTTH